MFRLALLSAVVAMGVAATAGCGGTPDTPQTCKRPPTPNISSVTPAVLTQFVSGQAIVVRGDTFSIDSQIELKGIGVTTLFVSAGELRATVPVDLVQSKGQVSVRVATTRYCKLQAAPTNNYYFTEYSAFLFLTVQ